ncbi:hypothetical protein SLEP1_g39197 [Rubroshorea leprosula]|uniref:Uncharacterized protein n=1 Tax=Rubroshorea leprosula TaxID=152421 RepID=A0AAV5KZQ7_9ROSI|nr:hypothetical protein SLEP1_g39197 [Rubroshorea leprosula]
MTSSPFLFPLFIFVFSPFLTAASIPLRLNNTQILQDVLKVIASSQKWDFDRLNFSKLQVSKVRFATGKRFDFRIRFGKSYFLLKFPDEVTSWNKFKKEGADFEDFIREVSSKAGLDSFKVEGPFELQVAGENQASLLLPFNTTHTGLKRIHVGEGITIEVTGAREVSFFHTFKSGSFVNGSFLKENGGFWSFWQSLCMPLPPILVSGSISLIAYRSRNPSSHIETLFLSKDTIKLLPEKCYSTHNYRRQACPIDAISLRIAKLEKALSRLHGNTSHKKVALGSINVKCKASITVRFHLELEKDIGKNETLQETLAEWRTRPAVEQLWFEVMARVEAEKLKPIMVKKVRPFVGVDTISWSNLMSNISFTQFSSILVPPEALTLGVKW